MGSRRLPRRLAVVGIAVVALLATSYFAALGATPGWLSYQHDAGRSGLDPDAAAVSGVSAGWNTQLDQSVYAQPLVAGNRVYAATENNTVYALDVTSGAIVWSQHLSAPITGGLPCGNIVPSGITGTPVIDTTNNVLYAVALQSSPVVHDELYALNLSAGGAVLYHYPIDAPGSTPDVQGQRGALTLANGKVYVPYSGRAGDCGNYVGRVVGVNTGDTTGATMVSYALPNTARGGIWAAGSADASGNLYFASGNSNAQGTTADRGESVVKLSPTLQELDYFTASDWSSLNANDTDIGSIGPILLQNGWILQSGKNGKGYLLDSGNMGHIGGQLFVGAICDPGQEALAFGAYLAPSTVFIGCTNALKAVHISTSGPPSFTVTTVRGGYGGDPGTSPPIIAGGVVWNLDTGNHLLLGFNPSTGQQLFAQGLAGTPVHFVAPSSGAGHIFVPSGSILEGFSLTSAGPTPTDTPTAAPTVTNTPVNTPTTGATATPTSTGSARPAMVQSAALDTFGATGAVGFTSPIASGDLLLAAVRIGDQNGASTVTDNNGNNWQLVDRRTENAGGVGDALELWYAPNASNAPNARPTLTIRSNISTATLRVLVAEYSGMLASNGVLDQHATAIGNSGAASASTGSTSQATELLIGYGEVQNTSTFTPGAGYGMAASVPTGGTKLAMEHEVVTTTGTQTAGFGISSQIWAMGIATFRASSVSVQGATPTPTNTPAPTTTPTRTPAVTLTPTPTTVAAQPAMLQSAVLDTFGAMGSIGFSNPLANGDLLIAAVRIGDQAGASTVTDNNANTWRLIDRRTESGAGVGDVLELWYASNASNAPNPRPTLTIRLNISTASVRVVAAEYTGVATSAALDQHATASGNSASAAASTGTTTQANELVIGYGEVENASTFTPGAGYTIAASVPGGSPKLAIAHTVITTTGPQTGRFGISSQAWAMGVATFRGAATP